MKPNPKESPNRLRIVDLTERCDHCVLTEKDAQLATEIAAGNYLRLRAEVDRLKETISRVANRPPVHDPVSIHGKGHSYSQDDKAPSISELQRRRG